MRTAALLFLFFISTLALAAERELSASLTTPTSIRVSNCDIDGGPTIQRVNIVIDNSLSEFMGVSWEYYDLPSQTWVDQGKLCNIPAATFTNCVIQVLPITLGGTGEGVLQNQPLLRLTGTSGAAPGDTFRKTFSFTIDHYVGEREASIITQLDQQQANYDEASSLCDAYPSCCTNYERRQLSDAGSKLDSAAQGIAVCDLALAYDSVVQAQVLSNSVKDAINECVSLGTATPTPARSPTRPSPTPAATQTPTRPPGGPRTPAPTAPPVETETPTERQTPTTSPTPAVPTQGLCPTSVALLLGGVGLAAFLRK